MLALLPMVLQSVDARQLHAAGKSAFEQSRHDEAITHFEELRRRWPDYEHVHHVYSLQGAALASVRRGEEALSCWELAVKAPNQMSAEQQGAFHSHVSSLVVRAAKVYHRFSSEAPDDIELRLAAGKLTGAAGQIQLAKDHLEAVLRLQPTRASAQLALGKLSAQDRPDEARSLLRSALALAPRQPGCVEAYPMLGALSCGAKDHVACYDAYVAAYETALAVGDARLAAVGIASAAMVAVEHIGGADGLAKAYALGERGVASGTLHAPLQLPKHFVRGLLAKPWWTSAELRVAKTLEQHARSIRQEILAAYAATNGFSKSAMLDNDSAGLVSAGHWAEINLVKNGQPQPQNIALLPYTSQLVMGLEEARSMVRGGSKVSIMQPGTLVTPHSGLSNSRLRIHLGISVPDDCGLLVNGERHTWTEEACISFDDSYVHSVWQNGTTPRIVFIVDVWHPELSSDEAREATLLEHGDRHLLGLYRAHARVTASGGDMSLLRPEYDKAMRAIEGGGAPRGGKDEL